MVNPVFFDKVGFVVGDERFVSFVFSYMDKKFSATCKLHSDEFFINEVDEFTGVTDNVYSTVRAKSLFESKRKMIMIYEGKV